MADQHKMAIRNSGKTVNAIAVEAGVPQPVLHRFVKGERGLTLTTVQKLPRLLRIRASRNMMVRLCRAITAGP
jgi:plasmid maintenance system antidote protein VapI